MQRTALAVFHTDCTLALQQDARGVRPGDDLQIAAAQVRCEVALGRAPALAIFVGHLVHAHALLAGTVEVRIGRVTRLLPSLHKDRAKRVGRGQIFGVQRAAAAMPRVCTTLVVLRFFEVRQHVVVSPARIALGGPMVVVFALATDIDHGIDGAGATQHFAARLVAFAAIEACLRHGLKTPVACARLRHQGQPGWAMDEHAFVCGACFEQADLGARVFT